MSILRLEAQLRDKHDDLENFRSDAIAINDLSDNVSYTTEQEASLQAVSTRYTKWCTELTQEILAIEQLLEYHRMLAPNKRMH